jgi:menaquinol-cytochrome c reductase iron-sulfur subunit
MPSLLAFMTPTLRGKGELRWIRVGEAALFDLGVPDRVDFNDNVRDAWVTQRVVRSVWLMTEDGETFTAYNARCPHLGCAFAFDEAKNHFACPCHKGVFEPKTGAVISGPPPRPLDRLHTKVEEGYVYVAYEDFRLGIAEKVSV